MKIIFLDIDGVLNSAEGEGPYISEMEISKLNLLKRLIDESHSSGVVITSDRRYSKYDYERKLNAFKEYGINVLGQTRLPKDDEDNRGKQIVDYLASFNDDVSRIAILDDIDDGISSVFEQEFILVNRYYGLNEDAYIKALKILND